MAERNHTEQVKTMPDEELRDTRRDLHTGIGLMRPQSPRYAPARAYLAAVTAELAGRAAARPDAWPRGARTAAPFTTSASRGASKLASAVTSPPGSARASASWAGAKRSTSSTQPTQDGYGRSSSRNQFKKVYIPEVTGSRES